MKKLAKEGAPVRSCVVVGRKATVAFSVRPEENSPDRYNLEGIVFDFSSCSEAQVVELAADAYRIRYQQAWRKAPAAERFLAKKWERTVDVKAEYFDAPRTRGEVDPATAAVRALVRGGMSQADAEQAVGKLLAPKKS